MTDPKANSRFSMYEEQPFTYPSAIKKQLQQARSKKELVSRPVDLPKEDLATIKSAKPNPNKVPAKHNLS